MASDYYSDWLDVVHAKLNELDAKVDNLHQCSDDEDFRTEFESICRRYRERYSTPLQGRLQHSSAHITAFASAVDTTAQPHLSAPDSTTSLFWTSVFATVEHARGKGLSFTQIIKALEHLYGLMPHLGPNVPRYNTNPRVQAPLHQIFSLLIDTHISIISICKDEPGGDLLNLLRGIEDRCKTVERRFMEYHSEYEKMLREVEDQERLESQIQLTNGAHGGDESSVETRVQYQFRRILGRGRFGDVSEVVELSTSLSYARKTIHLPSGLSAARYADIERDILNEVNVGYRLRHEHIVAILFFTRGPCSFSIFMLPVGECDLFYYLETKCIGQGFPSAFIKNIYPWFGCLSRALAFAHRLNIKHRDIKPSNIIIKDSQPYLADFGSARDFSSDPSSVSEDDYKKGTPVYRAPEIRLENQSSRRADIFALGAVFAEMLTVAKFRSLDDFRNQRRKESEDGEFNFRNNLPSTYEWLGSLLTDPPESAAYQTTDLLIDLIGNMLAMIPTDRPTAQACVHGLMRDSSLSCNAHH